MKLFDRLSKNPPESTGRPRTKSKEEVLGRRPRYACSIFTSGFLCYKKWLSIRESLFMKSFWKVELESYYPGQKKATIIEMGLVCITSWYPNFNGSHFGLPPSEIKRMTGLPPKIARTMTYSHRAHSRREERWHHAWLGAISVGQVRSVTVRDFCPALIAPDRAWHHTWNSVLLATNLEDGSFFVPQGSIMSCYLQFNGDHLLATHLSTEEEWQVWVAMLYGLWCTSICPSLIWTKQNHHCHRLLKKTCLKKNLGAA